MHHPWFSVFSTSTQIICIYFTQALNKISIHTECLVDLFNRNVLTKKHKIITRFAKWKILYSQNVKWILVVKNLCVHFELTNLFFALNTIRSSLSFARVEYGVSLAVCLYMCRVELNERDICVHVCSNAVHAWLEWMAMVWQPSLPLSSFHSHKYSSRRLNVVSFILYTCASQTVHVQYNQNKTIAWDIINFISDIEKSWLKLIKINGKFYV